MPTRTTCFIATSSPATSCLSGEHAVVADFGIAKAISEADRDSLTGTGIAVGTPEYMSPEQGSGDGTADRALRHLRARLRAVRDARRGAAVQWAFRSERSGPAPAGHSTTAAHRETRASTRNRVERGTRAGQDSRPTAFRRPPRLPRASPRRRPPGPPLRRRRAAGELRSPSRRSWWLSSSRRWY